MNGLPEAQLSQSALSANLHIGKHNQKEIALAMLKQGFRPKQIQEIVKISSPTISALRQALGLPKFPNRIPNQQIAEMVKSGATNAEIQSKCKCCVSCISAYRRKFNKSLPRGRKRGRNPETEKRVRDLKVAGHTYAEIGKLLGFSAQRAQQYLRVGRFDKKPSHCERCGKENRSLHGHHLDYATDSVQWLCNSCHMLTEYGS